MKFYLFSFLLGVFLILTSCVEESKITFNEIEISAEGNSIVSINIPKAEGDNIISDNINTTIYYTISQSLSFGEEHVNSEKSLEEQILEFNTEYNSFKKDFPNSAQEWEAQIDGDLMYQSEEIISIAISSYLDTGGAHGILTIRFLNFDPETGLKIENDKLFNDIKAIKSIAKSYFEEFIAENESEIFDTDEFLLAQNIGLEDEGVVILYNVYEVAPYATGIIQFTIPYNEISSYLNYN
jgi:hypothetical protein